MKTTNKSEKHRRAVELFDKNNSIQEVAHILNISKTLAKKWKKGNKRLIETNLKQRFKSDFATGKYSVNELARQYSVERRKLLKWKHELFGKGSVKRKRIYQMHLAGMPSKAIAEFFKVPLPQIYTSIRFEKSKYALKPQCMLFQDGK